MTKKVKDDSNRSNHLCRIMEQASVITVDLELKEITTGAVILSMLKYEKSVLLDVYLKNGIRGNPNYIFSDLFTKKEVYEAIFDKEFPFLDEEQENEVILQESTEKDQQEQQTIIFFGQNVYNFGYPYSENLKNVFLDAGERCRNCNQNYIDQENLLYSILSLENCSGSKILNSMFDDLEEDDIDFDMVTLTDFLINNYNICFSSTENKFTIPKPLESSCTVLNNKYTKGVKCDILGRDEELFEVWSILSKRQKSNAILLGEAGVGKSAIVEALTMSIVNGTCPEKFKDYKVVELNISGMVAGTKYRGEFEKKVEYLVNFINNYDNLIIFVDEIHQIMGAGSSEGSGPDLSGSLKPILARDKVKFIGATTLGEYKKYICTDNAFRRRLEPVEVKEPKQSEVLPMLKVKIDNLKKFHGVNVSKKVLDYIQLCASCFNTSTCNPDKTLDLIDRAMAIAADTSKNVNMEHVNKVFYKNYKQYNKNLGIVNRTTAYHEAGHFVVNYLYKDRLVDLEVYALSVVPGFGFLGANILEETDIQPKNDDDYYKAEIASLVAGRIAEEIFFNEKSSGASNDLGKATRIARTMIINYGLSSGEYANFSLYDEQTGNNIPYSEKALDVINKEAKEIVDSVYRSTKELLSRAENKAKIDIVAKTLLKKKIVSARELEDVISTL